MLGQDVFRPTEEAIRECSRYSLHLVGRLYVVWDKEQLRRTALLNREDHANGFFDLIAKEPHDAQHVGTLTDQPDEAPRDR